MARPVARNQDRASISSGSPSRGLRLVEPLGPRTWRGIAEDGTPVAARWLSALAPPTAGSTAGLPSWPPAGLPAPPGHPGLLPVLGIARTDRALWLLSELDTGVDLLRLSSAVRLTPLQSAAVLDDVLAALEALHANGRWHGRLHAGNVHVGAAGQVRVTDWGPSWLVPGILDGHRAVDLAAAGRLAAALVAGGARPPHRPGSRQSELYDAVRHQAEGAAVPGADRPGSAPLLLGHEERAKATAELSTLSQAMRRSRRPLGTPLGQSLVPRPRTPDDHRLTAPARSVPVVSTGPPVLPRLRPRRRTLGRRTGVILSVLLVLAVAAELVVLGPGIRADWRRLTTAPQGSAPPQGASGATGEAPLPRLGPAASGAVTGVAVRPLARCLPGQVCDLRVLVRVWPNDTRRVPVAWRIVVVDRCSGVRVERPGGAAVAAIGSDRVDGLSHVLLPRGRSLAVAAVTSEPASAASATIAVPATAGSC